jgi:hypothetical protein
VYPGLFFGFRMSVTIISLLNQVSLIHTVMFLITQAMPDERGRRFPQWHADSPYQECEDFIAELEQARSQ